METFLTLLSGIAWTVVYIDAIRIGIKDKSYAMPYGTGITQTPW